MCGVCARVRTVGGVVRATTTVGVALQSVLKFCDSPRWAGGRGVQKCKGARRPTARERQQTNVSHTCFKNARKKHAGYPPVTAVTWRERSQPPGSGVSPVLYTRKFPGSRGLSSWWKASDPTAVTNLPQHQSRKSSLAFTYRCTDVQLHATT